MGKGKKRRHQPLALEVRLGTCPIYPVACCARPFHHPSRRLPDQSIRRAITTHTQLDEDAREQREMELKRKRMLRRRTEGQGDDDARGSGAGGAEEDVAAAAALLEGGEGRVS